MNIVTILLVCAMAAALMAALIHSAFAGTKSEMAFSHADDGMLNKVLRPKDDEEESDVTYFSLRFYCWVANLRELSAIENGIADPSMFRGPIPLISGREDGSIRIINSERGSTRGREGDLDISEIFPSDSDDLYRSSNRCFSHHEADITFDKATGTVHLVASEEKARRNRPNTMYSFSTGKQITDMPLTDNSCAVIGDYLFIFTFGSQLPPDILCAEKGPVKKAARKTAARTKTASTGKRTASASAKKSKSTASAAKRKKPAANKDPEPTVIAS